MNDIYFQDQYFSVCFYTDDITLYVTDLKTNQTYLYLLTETLLCDLFKNCQK